MKLIIVAIIGLAAFGVSQAEAAPQKYDVKHVTGEQTAPIDCPPLWTPTLEKYGIADCNVADGTLVARNFTPAKVHAHIDTSLTYPEYE